MDKAVALKYSSDLPAPFLLAKGKKHLAEKLVRIAEEKGIKILSEEDLTDRLFLLEPGDFIPEEVFEVVARILAFVYQTHGKTE